MDRQNIEDRRISRKETREERERVRDTERKKEREVRKDNGEEMGEIISFNIESMRVKSVGKVSDTRRKRRKKKERRKRDFKIYLYEHHLYYLILKFVLYYIIYISQYITFMPSI